MEKRKIGRSTRDSAGLIPWMSKNLPDAPVVKWAYTGFLRLTSPVSPAATAHLPSSIHERGSCRGDPLHKVGR